MTGLLRACTGLIVWAVIFSLLYGIEGMGCAAPWDRRVLRASLVIVWLVGVAALAALSWQWTRVRPHRDVERIGQWLAIAGLIATIVTGLPVATLSLCV
ncbi:hypothetical protein [Sphingomonas sp. AX6]|uniref:hypothetical protein n=1 Tax=Sphingomonas sp. AX6 TaxID=2653171 RepID=UPI0012EF4AE8|nr:hypothetical protein [Sphingomonas sp. AX6]VXC68215.1 conserved membrane hypothetical protein [Sphingomonas sp. AX6]